MLALIAKVIWMKGNSTQKDLSKKADSKNDAITLYSIPIWKLIALSTVSFGFYHIYWFYKQWKGVKQIQNLEASPLSRAILSGIWIFSLLPRILKITTGNNRKLTGIFLAILWYIFGFAIGSTNYYFIPLSTLPLIPVQIAINKYK